MDWSKAKNILIAALLITNLMLGMAIYSNVSGPGSREMNEMIQNTIRLLEDHDILVANIPDVTYRTIDSVFGHDGFLVEHKLLNDKILDFIQDEQ